MELYFIDRSATIRDALSQLKATRDRTLVVIDETRRLIGTFTEGDLAKAILASANVEFSSVSDWMNRTPFYLEDSFGPHPTPLEVFIDKGHLVYPVVDSDMRVTKVMSLRHYLSESFTI